MKNVVADKAETHADNVTNHIVHVHILFGIGKDEIVFVEIII